MQVKVTEQDRKIFSDLVPWRGVGKIVSGAMTGEEALDEIGLNWKVKKELILSSKGQQHPSKCIIVREDNGRILADVSYKYGILQNIDAFKIMDEVTMDPNGPKIVAMGMLDSGAVVWAIYKLPEFIEVVNHDVISEYVILLNSHNGKYRYSLKWTPIRHFCTNFIIPGTKNISFKHFGMYNEKIPDIRKALGIMKNNHNMLNELLPKFVKHKINETEMEKVLDVVYPLKDGSENYTQQSARTKVLELFEVGRGNDLKEVRGSAYAFYNAILEREDHYAKGVDTSRKQLEGRFTYTLEGIGANRKELAFDLISQMVRS